MLKEPKDRLSNLKCMGRIQINSSAFRFIHIFRHYHSFSLFFRQFLTIPNDYMLGWREYYILDLQFDRKENHLYDPGYIKTLRNVIGQLLRYIYYGSADERNPLAPWILYSTLQSDVSWHYRYCVAYFHGI